MSDLTVDGSETAEENIVGHESILTNPVSQGVEVTGLRRVKNGLDNIDVGITVLTRNIVRLCPRPLSPGAWQAPVVVAISSTASARWGTKPHFLER
jgi:hypothetical protein